MCLQAAAQPPELRIRATLQPRGPAAAIVLDDTQLAGLSTDKKTPTVRATVNGHTFSTRIGRMHGETLLGFNKATREACRVAAGDEIDVIIVLDEAPREVDVPQDLNLALAEQPGARAAFDHLAYSHRKEFVRWINDAKRDNTRQRRIAETLSKLANGQVR